ncbi:MAG: hypothetical protein E2P01_08230 [Acidobacteria bacterium]|nr:MAG: hypothetical protein E2P01_08230 [Acidobacteriota bacterium]
MSVMRQQVGLVALVAASVVLAFLAVGYHAHDDALDASPHSHSISVVCQICTLVHVSPAPAVNCIGPHVPCPGHRLEPPGAAPLPRAPVLCSHASRAPPAPSGLGA